MRGEKGRGARWQNGSLKHADPGQRAPPPGAFRRARIKLLRAGSSDFDAVNKPMEESWSVNKQFRLAVPIRVRGMSSRNKFFDEDCTTAFVGDQSAVIRLRNLVDLESEVHVMSLKTNVGGTFRVLWVNTREVDGFHDVGLELIDPEGDLWELESAPAQSEAPAAVPQAWLECRRCHQRLLTPVPEVQAEYLREGLLLARHCETCKATTAWAAAESGAPPEAQPPSESVAREDQRAKGRAPIEIMVKVIRRKYGTTIEDICKTLNVSRTGVYFLTAKYYDLHEPVEVILPYKEGDVSIPLPAFVVRQDEAKETFEHGVALRLGSRSK